MSNDLTPEALKLRFEYLRGENERLRDASSAGRLQPALTVRLTTEPAVHSPGCPLSTGEEALDQAHPP
jgi:hypothetical protein